MAKAAKTTDKVYEPIPEDAFIYPLDETGKTVFLGYYSEYTPDDKDVTYRNLTFTKGFYTKEGELRRSGRSATLPIELMADPAERDQFIESLGEWITSQSEGADIPKKKKVTKAAPKDAPSRNTPAPVKANTPTKKSLFGKMKGRAR